MSDIFKLYGEFTWDFGQTFFIETAEGNFVWSDPGYNGSNEIHRFKGTYNDWIKSCNIPYGRCKGKHFIEDYCPGAVFIE